LLQLIKRISFKHIGVIFLAPFLFVGCVGTSKSFTYKTESDLSKFRCISEINTINAANYSGNKDILSWLNKYFEEALREKGYWGQDSGCDSLTAKITKYNPGNAFYRWVAPGLGATDLNILVTLYNNGSKRTDIFLKESVAAGGGFSIAQYKLIFGDISSNLIDEVSKL